MVATDEPMDTSSGPKDAKDPKDAKKAETEAEISEEDQKLQDDLNLLLERLSEPNVDLHLPSLETMRSLIRASTTSMTSVPKPLKYMRPHYAQMKEIFAKMTEGKTKQLCGDIISVLAMCSDEQKDCVDFRLKGQHEPIGNWGHEYVRACQTFKLRHLCMEMNSEWQEAVSGTPEGDKRRGELLQLVREIIQHNMAHNAEVEACDLLIEIEQLPLLLEFVGEADHTRVCLYLLSCSPLTPNPDNHTLIRTAKDLYLKFGKTFDALRCAIMLNDVELIREIFLSCPDLLLQKQMAILLGRHQIFLELEDTRLAELNSNVQLHQYFRSLARELDIMEPKTPESIYKAHLETGRPFAGAQADSKRIELAASFVNGFVNCGFGADKMLDDGDGANRWFSKQKDYASLSAAASLGLIHRWDIDNGLAQIDRFLSSEDDNIRAGTLLAIGIISCGVQDPVDPACAILIEHVHSDRIQSRIGAILGLGLAYANSKRETVVKDEPGGVIYELRKIFSDNKPSATPEVKGLAGLALGLILVGTADHEVASDLLTYLMDDSLDFKDANHRFVALGIGLIFLGTQERSEVFIESLRALPEPFGSMTATLVDVCAFAGTGNVLKIQNLLHICSEHYEIPKDEKKGAKATEPKTPAPAEGGEEKVDFSPMQAVAVLGIGLIAMGEDIGAQMSVRTFGHLMRYGEPVIRRAVPLALGLISTSNPQLTILETLNKYSHDSDAETAHNAIFALGLVGAGTNNARLVAMLRQLASYHVKDQTSMMLVRIAQGLTHLGKGTMTLNPFHSDRQLMCPAAVASLFSTCFAFIDADKTILSNKQHYLLNSLVVAIQPRLLITLVEDEQDPDQLKQVNVSVRVGQAVNVVAQAGKPKTITGFQTHSTPVLLAYGERAELATDEYIPLTSHLEGLVILKKNPDSEILRAANVSTKKK